MSSCEFKHQLSKVSIIIQSSEFIITYDLNNIINKFHTFINIIPYKNQSSNFLPGSIITTFTYQKPTRPLSSQLTYTSSQLGYLKLKHWVYSMEFQHDMSGFPWVVSHDMVLTLRPFKESLELTLWRKCDFIEYR